MPLRHFIYRCPYCGHEPTEGTGPRATCPGCRRTFEPAGSGTKITVTERDGERADVLAASFVAGGGPSLELSEPPEGDGTSIQAAASMRIATGERTLWARGSVLGYIERLGRRTVGALRLSHEGLAFVEDGGRVHSWALEDIRALQGSSSTVQISPATGGVVSFRLRSDSSRRWEDLLKDRLRALWREQGRGEIVEFQPRIRSW